MEKCLKQIDCSKLAVSIKYLKTLKSLIGGISMKVRVILTLLFGIVQSLLALLAMALATAIYLNLFDLQVLWDITPEAASFHLAILIAFSVFLIASGLFLINEWREIH